MNPAALIDGPSAAIVLGGTVLATLLRCGREDSRIALRVLARLGRQRFDAEAVRAELAVQVQEIRQDGLVRAHPHIFGDTEFAEATGALIETRSIDGLLERHAAHRARRTAAAEVAARTFATAADLAPVFGLAGTLLSLSQLPADGLGRGAFAGAISMAVLSTLYGLAFANVVLAPLSRAVERAIAREEDERQKLFDWLAHQVGEACARAAPVRERAEP